MYLSVFCNKAFCSWGHKIPWTNDNTDNKRSSLGWCLFLSLELSTAAKRLVAVFKSGCLWVMSNFLNGLTQLADLIVFSVMTHCCFF